MKKLYCILGPSASGKDTILWQLAHNEEFQKRTSHLTDCGYLIEPLISATTRPKRDGEQNGVNYHFITKNQLSKYISKDQVIEHRAYDTNQGIWYYATIKEQFLEQSDSIYVIVTSVDQYISILDYYGEALVKPIYLNVPEDVLLLRAIEREQSLTNPDYVELCRRFIDDRRQFSKDTLALLNISKEAIILNNKEDTLQSVLTKIFDYIIGDITNDN